MDREGGEMRLLEGVEAQGGRRRAECGKLVVQMSGQLTGADPARSLQKSLQCPELGVLGPPAVLFLQAPHHL